MKNDTYVSVSGTGNPNSYAFVPDYRWGAGREIRSLGYGTYTGILRGEFGEASQVGLIVGLIAVDDVEALAEILGTEVFSVDPDGHRVRYVPGSPAAEGWHRPDGYVTDQYVRRSRRRWDGRPSPALYSGNIYERR